MFHWFKSDKNLSFDTMHLFISIEFWARKNSRNPDGYWSFSECIFLDHSLWRRHPDLNRGIRVLQTHALPLGYVAMDEKSVLRRFFRLERLTRLELATSTLARWRSTR